MAASDQGWWCLQCGFVNSHATERCKCGVRYGHVICRDCSKQSPHVQCVWRPPHYFCDACKWDRYIPNGHQKLEKYLYDAVWKQLNATGRPRLGVQFLDVQRQTLEEISQNLPAKALNGLTNRM